MPLLHVPQFITTTLNVGGGIDASQTTGIILQSDSGLDKTKPGMACITFADPLNTSLAEWLLYTSIDGSNELVGVLRGQEGYSAKTHANGATIAFPISASHINNLAIAGATGWIQDTATWTRTGNHTFTVAGNRTLEFRKGTKVRYKDGGAFEYGVVASSSYSAPNTTVTMITNTDFTMSATTITDTWVSYVENAEGFPTSFNRTAGWSSDGTQPSIGNGTLTSKFSVYGIGQIHLTIKILIGSTTNVGTGSYSFSLPVGADTSQNYTSTIFTFDSSATTARDVMGVIYSGTLNGYVDGAFRFGQSSPFALAQSDEIHIDIHYRF